MRQALTHCSYANEAPGNVEDNEPLEFLGDAILSFIVSDELCRRYPTFREGRLSRSKASLVQTSTLAELSIEIDLGKYLLLGKGEEKSGGAQKESLLANAFEALIAVVYLDGGIRAGRSFINRMLGHRLLEIGGAEKILDPKSAVKESVQSRGLGIPVYDVIEERGPDHHKTFVIELKIEGKGIGRGEGRSKKLAQQRAAREGLKTLEDRVEEESASEPGEKPEMMKNA